MHCSCCFSSRGGTGPAFVVGLLGIKDKIEGVARGTTGATGAIVVSVADVTCAHNMNALWKGRVVVLVTEDTRTCAGSSRRVTCFPL